FSRDWSSDVCSSDLEGQQIAVAHARRARADHLDAQVGEVMGGRAFPGPVEERDQAEAGQQQNKGDQKKSFHAAEGRRRWGDCQAGLCTWISNLSVLIIEPRRQADYRLAR